MPPASASPRRAPFLAVHDVPPGRERDALQDAFDRAAREAAKRGLRPIASFYSPERRRAYTLMEAGDADEVRDACEAAGLRVVDVLHGAQLARTLMEEPTIGRRVLSGGVLAEAGATEAAREPMPAREPADFAADAER